MKIFFSLTIFVTILTLNIFTLNYLNKIISYQMVKEKNFKKGIELINEMEKIQGMSLDSFLKNYNVKKSIEADNEILHIFTYIGHDFLYIEEK